MASRDRVRNGDLCKALAVVFAGAAVLPQAAQAGPLSAAASVDPLLSLCLATGSPVDPRTLWHSWSLAPEIVVPLLAALGLYLKALARRGPGLRAGRSHCFLAGWAALAIALVSPLCRAAANLACAHMIQHMLVTAVAPPLLVLGWRSMPPASSRARRWLPVPRQENGRAVLAGGLYVGVIWTAHLPLVYEGALRSPVVHLLLLAALLLVSLLFWAAVIGPPRGPAREGSSRGGTGILLCVFAVLQTGMLGALLVVSDQLWYPIYASRAPLWGLSPIEDQQLAGLVMWVAMDAIFLATALMLLGRLLAPAEASRPAG